MPACGRHAYFEIKKMGFAAEKEVIRRFSGLADRFQAIFVLFRGFYWNFRQELCSSAMGLASGVDRRRPRPPKCWNNVAVDRPARCCFNRWNSLWELGALPRGRLGGRSFCIRSYRESKSHDYRSTSTFTGASGGKCTPFGLRRICVLPPNCRRHRASMSAFCC